MDGVNRLAHLAAASSSFSASPVSCAFSRRCTFWSCIQRAKHSEWKAWEHVTLTAAVAGILLDHVTLTLLEEHVVLTIAARMLLAEA